MYFNRPTRCAPAWWSTLYGHRAPGAAAAGDQEEGSGGALQLAADSDDDEEDEGLFGAVAASERAIEELRKTSAGEAREKG